MNPCEDGNVHMYGTTKEAKQKVFTIDSQNKTQEIGMYPNDLYLKYKLQK